jgi:hypothetical protein
MDINPQVLNWNPHGLNDRAKRNTVREFVDLINVNLGNAAECNRSLCGFAMFGSIV